MTVHAAYIFTRDQIPLKKLKYMTFIRWQDSWNAQKHHLLVICDDIWAANELSCLWHCYFLTSKHYCRVCNAVCPLIVCEETCKEFWEMFRTNEDVAKVTCRVVNGNFTLKATNKWISYKARQWKNFISAVRCLISMLENPCLCWEGFSLLPFRAALL